MAVTQSLDDYFSKIETPSNWNNNSEGSKNFKFKLFNMKTTEWKMIYFFYPKIITNQVHFVDGKCLPCSGNGCELCEKHDGDTRKMKQDLSATFVLTKTKGEYSIEIVSATSFVFKIIKSNLEKIDKNNQMLLIQKNPENNRYEFKAFDFNDKYNLNIFKKEIKEKFVLDYEGEDLDSLKRVVKVKVENKPKSSAQKASDNFYDSDDDEPSDRLAKSSSSSSSTKIKPAFSMDDSEPNF